MSEKSWERSENSRWHGTMLQLLPSVEVFDRARVIRKPPPVTFYFSLNKSNKLFFVLWASFEACSYFAGAELCNQNQQCRFLGWVFSGYSVNSVQCSLGSFNLCQFDSQVHYSFALDQYQVLPRFCFTTLMNTHCGAQIKQLSFDKSEKLFYLQNIKVNKSCSNIRLSQTLRRLWSATS